MEDENQNQDGADAMRTIVPAVEPRAEQVTPWGAPAPDGARLALFRVTLDGGDTALQAWRASADGSWHQLAVGLGPHDPDGVRAAAHPLPVTSTAAQMPPARLGGFAPSCFQRVRYWPRRDVPCHPIETVIVGWEEEKTSQAMGTGRVLCFLSGVGYVPLLQCEPLHPREGRTPELPSTHSNGRPWTWPDDFVAGHEPTTPKGGES